MNLTRHNSGIYFRSNHERLLDELSRAITIIAHGLERLVRDKDTISGLSEEANTDDTELASLNNTINHYDRSQTTMLKSKEAMTNGQSSLDSRVKTNSKANHMIPSRYSADINSTDATTTSKQDRIYTSLLSSNSSSLGGEQSKQSDGSQFSGVDGLQPELSLRNYRQKLLSASSRCYGASDELSKKRGGLLYE